MDEKTTDQTADQTTAPAHGEHTTHGRPHGFSSLTPFLVVERAREAIDFYADVFGARVLGVTEMGGLVAHAELQLDDGRLQIGQPNPEYGLVAPPGEGDCYSLGLYCTDVDELVARAEEAGAEVREAPTTFVSGDRFASLRDPFGVRWSVMTRVEDLSEAESARRVEEWAAQQG
ncbi:VOC family protein [Nocardioides daphniae]|nr:VOC family protein [Nocardioides daphniae]QCC77943.1 VOC family protein [Nocardioides daphniae]